MQGGLLEIKVELVWAKSSTNASAPSLDIPEAKDADLRQVDERDVSKLPGCKEFSASADVSI